MSERDEKLNKSSKGLTVRKKTIYGLVLFVLSVLFFSMNFYTEQINKFIAVAVLALSAIWVYQCWNVLCLLVISLFIAYSNYSIVVGIYLDETLRPSYLYPQITDVNVYGIGIALLFLFMLGLVSLTPKYKKKIISTVSISFIRENNYNSVLFFVATIAFLAFLLLGYKPSSGSRGSSSALYEYNIIVLLIMFFYSGNRKKCKIVCSICAGAYVLMSLLNGTRIEALACIIISFLCLTRKEIKRSVLLAGMFLGVVVFSCVGTIRGGTLSAELGKKILTGLLKNKLVFDTCTHAYFPMLCMIEQFQKFSVSNAVHFLTAFLGTILMGQSRVVDGDLIQTMAKHYYHNYGGVTVGFFWVWFSYIGSAVFAYIVYMYSRLIANTSHKTNDLRLCVIIFVTATVPRWYLYGPWSLTRGVLVCIVVFTVFKCGNKILRR